MRFALAIVITGAAKAASTFDPAAWFARWSDHGGVAFIANDRLHLSRLAAIDATAHRRLDFLRGELFRQRGGDAVKALLVARREGEAA